MSFDEGGVASRSTFNPVHQYNKDQPQKFYFDFYLLCNNSPEKIFTLHCNVYQGKNADNIGIPEEITHPQATQKSVVNSIIPSKLGMDPNGICQLFMLV